LIRVLVADDHVTVLEGLMAIIGRQPDMSVVAGVSNGCEACESWKDRRPDVTLLDLRMPLLDGVAAIEEIRRMDPAARVIVLTTYDTDNDIARAVQAGARAYLLKDTPREAMLDTIRRVHRGELCVTAPSAAAESLTPREHDVLRFLGHGHSNKDIASRLSISEMTVKTHLRSIFSKLQVSNRTEAIAAATRKGLISSF
jgi:two-component system, NarL family, response regulator